MLKRSKVEGLTVEERIKTVKSYYKNYDFAVFTLRDLRTDYDRHHRPTHRANKCKETGSITDTVRHVRVHHPWLHA